MVNFTNLLALVAIASASVLPRDITPVLNDLKQIDTDTNSLTSLVTNWNGAAGTSQPILQKEAALETDLKNANTDASGQPVPSDADATTVLNYIKNTLEPDVVKSISAIINKKTQFTNAGLYSTVKKDLANLRSLTQTYSNTLISKTPTAEKAAASSLAAKLDNDFVTGQNAYP